MKEAFEGARLYLDEWVPPHRLVSVSAFEEDHPNTNGTFNVVILVRGSIEKPIQTDSSIGKIYNIVMKSDSAEGGWVSVLRQGLTAAEDRECGTLSTFNVSNNEMGGQVDNQAVVAFTWSKAHEDMLIDSERGFCNCAIF
jgi:hypothetical protein